MSFHVRCGGGAIDVAPAACCALLAASLLDQLPALVDASELRSGAPYFARVKMTSS